MRSRLKLAKTNDFCVGGKAKLTVVLIHGIASDSSTYNKALAHFREDKKLEKVRLLGIK